MDEGSSCFGARASPAPHPTSPGNTARPQRGPDPAHGEELSAASYVVSPPTNCGSPAAAELRVSPCPGRSSGRASPDGGGWDEPAAGSDGASPQPVHGNNPLDVSLSSVTLSADYPAIDSARTRGLESPRPPGHGAHNASPESSPRQQVRLRAAGQSALLDEMLRLRGDLRLSREQADRQEHDVQKLRDRCQAEADKRAEASRALSVRTAELDRVRRDAAAADVEHRRQVSDLEKRLRESEDRAAAAEESYSAAAAAAASSSSTNGELTQRAEAAEAAERRARESLGALLEDANKRSLESCERLQSERKARREVEAELRERIRTLEASAEHNEHTLDRVRRDATLLRSELAEARSPVVSHHSRAASLAALSDSPHHRTDAPDADTRVRVAEMRRAEAEAELTESRAELAQLRKQRADSGTDASSAETARRLRHANDAIERAANPAFSSGRARRGVPELGGELSRSEDLADVIVNLRRDICRDAAERSNELDDYSLHSRRLRRAVDAIERGFAPQETAAEPGEAELGTEVTRVERLVDRIERLHRDLEDEKEAAEAAQTAAVAQSAACARSNMECEQLRRELVALRKRPKPDEARSTPAASRVHREEPRRRTQSVSEPNDETISLRRRVTSLEAELLTAKAEAAQLTRVLQHQRERESELRADLEVEERRAAEARKQCDDASRELSEAKWRFAAEDEAAQRERDKVFAEPFSSPVSPQPEEELSLLQTLRANVRSEQHTRVREREMLLKETDRLRAELQTERETHLRRVAEARAKASATVKRMEELEEDRERARGEAAAACIRLRGANDIVEKAVEAGVDRNNPRDALSLSIVSSGAAAAAAAAPPELALEVARSESLARAATNMARSAVQRSDSAVDAEQEARRLRKANDALDRALLVGSDDSPIPTAHALADEVDRVEHLLPKVERAMKDLIAERDTAAAAEERAVAEAAAKAKVTLEAGQLARKVQRLSRELDARTDQHLRELAVLRGDAGDRRDHTALLQRELAKSVAELAELRKGDGDGGHTSPPGSGKESPGSAHLVSEEVSVLRSKLSLSQAATTACAKRLQRVSDGLEEAMCCSPRRAPLSADIQSELPRIEGLARRAAERLRAHGRGQSVTPGWVDVETRRLRRCYSALEQLARTRGVEIRYDSDGDAGAEDSLTAMAARLEAAPAALDEAFRAADGDAEQLREAAAVLEQRANDAVGDAAATRRELERRGADNTQRKHDLEQRLRRSSAETDRAHQEASAFRSALHSASDAIDSSAARLRDVNSSLEATVGRVSVSPAVQPDSLMAEVSIAEALAAKVQQAIGGLRRELAVDASQAAEARALVPRLRHALDCLSAPPPPPQAPQACSLQLGGEVARAETLVALSRPPTRLEDERRVDAADGCGYTFAEFVDCYGEQDGRLRWAAAPAEGAAWPAADGAESEPPQLTRLSSANFSQRSASSTTSAPPLPTRAPAYLGMEVGEGLSIGGGKITGARLRITQVTAGGPASSSGLRVGDAVLEVGARPVMDLDTFRESALRTMPGDVVKVLVQRDGAPAPLLLRVRAAEPPARGFTPGSKHVERRALLKVSRSQQRAPSVSGDSDQRPVSARRPVRSSSGGPPPRRTAAQRTLTDSRPPPSTLPKRPAASRRSLSASRQSSARPSAGRRE